MADDNLRPLIDDPAGIPNTAVLLRVVQRGYYTGRTVQSNAFQDQSLEKAHEWGLASRCASVIVRSIWEEAGADVNDLLRDFDPGAGLVELSAESIRSLHTRGDAEAPQGLMLDPRPGAPWHAVMFDLKADERGKAARRALVDEATWFWHPQD
jgi:hypothetical protein